MTTGQTVAFIGLGVMGYPVAGHLARAGHAVTVYNRTAAKAERFAREFSARSAPTPRAAAEGADVVFACVGNDDDLRAVTLGETGALKGMKPGAIFVDHTTASARRAECPRSARRGGAAPLSDRRFELQVRPDAATSCRDSTREPSSFDYA